MSTFTRLLLVLGVLILVGGVGYLCRKLLAKRTIANWSGAGVNEDLAPWQAAVLLGVHPAVFVAILLEELRLRGRAIARADRHGPCRLEWIGGPPETASEEALLQAVDDDGVFRPDGVLALVERMWEETDAAMVLWSGRATAVHFRNFARKMWDRDLDAILDLPGSFPFLLLTDPGREWDRLGDDPSSARFKESFRVTERFRSRLAPEEVWARAARQARGGFFFYRKDLIRRDPDRFVSHTFGPR